MKEHDQALGDEELFDEIVPLDSGDEWTALEKMDKYIDELLAKQSKLPYDLSPALLGKDYKAEEHKELPCPPLDVTIVFGPHETAADALAIAPHLQHADVYLPEIHGWDENTIRLLNAVSQGSLTPEAALQEQLTDTDDLDTVSKMTDFWLQVYRNIAGTKIPVACADMPFGHSLVGRQNHLIELGVQWDAEFAATLKAARQYIQQVVECTTAREQYIAEHIKQAVAQLVAVDAQLQARAESGTLKVVLSLGEEHARMIDVVHELWEKEGWSAPRAISSETSVHNRQPTLLSTAEQQLLAGQELSDEHVAWVLLEQVLLRHSLMYDLVQTMGSEVGGEVAARYIAEQFNLEEIEELFVQAVQLAHGHAELIPAMMDTLLRGENDEDEGEVVGVMVTKGIVLEEVKKKLGL